MLWRTSQKTSGLTPEALVDHLFEYLTTARGVDALLARQRLLADYVQSGARAKPHTLQALLTRRAKLNSALVHPQIVIDGSARLALRQARHAG